MESQIWEIVNNIVPIFRPSPWSQLKNELTLSLVSQFWINFWPGLDLMNFPIAISYPKRRFPLPNRINFWKKIQMAFDPPPPSFLENYVGNFYRTRVRSLAMLVTNWLTHWLLFSRLDCYEWLMLSQQLLKRLKKLCKLSATACKSYITLDS